MDLSCSSSSKRTLISISLLHSPNKTVLWFVTMVTTCQTHHNLWLFLRQKLIGPIIVSSRCFLGLVRMGFRQQNHPKRLHFWMLTCCLSLRHTRNFIFWLETIKLWGISVHTSLADKSATCVGSRETWGRREWETKREVKRNGVIWSLYTGIQSPVPHFTGWPLRLSLPPRQGYNKRTTSDSHGLKQQWFIPQSR